MRVLAISQERARTRSCLDCLLSFAPPEMREGFRSKTVHCTEWGTTVKITHARICPYFLDKRRRRARGWRRL